jgi:hypothetical protein
MASRRPVTRVPTLRRRPTALVPCAVAAAALLWCTAAAPQVAVIPPLVVRDGQGDVVGPVVGFETLTQPIVRLVDEEVGVPVFVVVRTGQLLEAGIRKTYFGGSDCTGTPYHDPAFADAIQGLAQLTGYAYSVADVGGLGAWLIRSGVSASGAFSTYQSRFDGACTNASPTSKFLRPALAIRDLGAEFPPEYTAQ